MIRAPLLWLEELETMKRGDHPMEISIPEGTDPAFLGASIAAAGLRLGNPCQADQRPRQEDTQEERQRSAAVANRCEMEARKRTGNESFCSDHDRNGGSPGDRAIVMSGGSSDEVQTRDEEGKGIRRFRFRILTRRSSSTFASGATQPSLTTPPPPPCRGCPLCRLPLCLFPDVA